MPPIDTFTPEQNRAVHEMLVELVRVLRIVPGGGKIEEDYWSHVYHEVRGSPVGNWSNLPMRDYCYEGIGVEMKLLKRTQPSADQGRRLMHPAATRTINFDPQASAEICKKLILSQFGQQISQFRQRVRESSERQPEIRWGHDQLPRC